LQAVRQGDIRLAEFTAGLRSTLAHWRFADSFRLQERLFRRLGLHHSDQVPASEYR